MWDMSSDPFENELSRLFLKPSGEADPVRLKLMVLERLQREDRRRGVVITAAAGVGVAIAAGALAASRFGDVVSFEMNRLASAMPQPAAVDTTSLLASVLVLGLGAVLAFRVLRDV